MANHFANLLRYILDRQEVVAPICYPNDFPMYQSALDYVQDNGVNCYGALVYAQADELNAFMEAEGITYIQINDVLPSVFASNKH